MTSILNLFESDARYFKDMGMRETTAKARTGAAVCVLLLAQTALVWAGGSQKALARGFARLARKAGVSRVAILPFRPLDDSPTAQGRHLAEELTTFLARTGGVQVVERAMLDSVLSEHRLAASGAFGSENLARLGRLLQAQAVVVGTFISFGSTVELNARLIHLESGVVLAAGSKRLKGAQFSDYRRGAPRAQPLTRTSRFKPARLAGVSSPHPKRVGCEFAEDRINSLIGSVVNLKARYWAHQVRTSRLPRSTLHKPGQAIPDPALRARFYELADIAAHEQSPPLDMAEIKRFLKADREAFILQFQCAGKGSNTVRRARHAAKIASRR